MKPNKTACICVDCPKITEDKSSESKDARLTIATRAAPRHKGWNPHLNITTITKTQRLKSVSQHHCSTRTQESKLAFLLHYNGQDAELKNCVSVIHAIPRRRTQSPHLTWSLTQNLKFAFLKRYLNGKSEAQSPRFSYNCPHYRVNYYPRNKGVNPHCGRFLGDSFTPWNPYK